MVRVIYRKEKHDCTNLLGTFLDSRHYDEILTKETDLYAPSIDGSMTEENIVLKFRKQVFNKDEQRGAYEGLRGAACQSQNRGTAAGPRGAKLQTSGRGGRDWVTPYQVDVMDWLSRSDNILDDSLTLEDIRKRNYDTADNINGHVWMRSAVIAARGEYDDWFDKWVDELVNLSREEQRNQANHVREKFISNTCYAASVMSGIAGFFDRYPRTPYGRACAYNERHSELFELSFPYLQKLDRVFAEELPLRWAYQKSCIDQLDSRFYIPDTTFTTLTVNHNWRTAAHLDAGDLGKGFSNLSTITSKDGWEGGEFILPEYRVAVKFEPGDLLLVANHTGIHGNGALSDTFDNDRLSIVAYFRENMLQLKSYEYEMLRKQYIEERKNDPNHRYKRKLWNGINPSMWEEKEWFDYMKKHNVPNPYQSKFTSLEGFF